MHLDQRYARHVNDGNAQNVSMGEKTEIEIEIEIESRETRATRGEGKTGGTLRLRSCRVRIRMQQWKPHFSKQRGQQALRKIPLKHISRAHLIIKRLMSLTLQDCND